MNILQRNISFIYIESNYIHVTCVSFTFIFEGLQQRKVTEQPAHDFGFDFDWDIQSTVSVSDYTG